MMKKNFQDMSSDELVSAYEKIIVEQDKSFLLSKIAKYNREYKIRAAIVDELRARPGDQRQLLVPFLDRREPWMRICVASDTYSLNPERSRQYMQTVVDYPFDPYRGEAASALGGWSRGNTPR